MLTTGFKFDKPVRKKHTNRVKSKATRKRRKLVREADAEVRAEVFERDGNKCVRCGQMSYPGHTLSPSHVYPKGKYPRLRFLSINILTMCYGCHIHWWHKHPIEAAEWFLKTYPDRAAQLRLLKDTAPKVELRGER